MMGVWDWVLPPPPLIIHPGYSRLSSPQMKLAWVQVYLHALETIL